MPRPFERRGRRCTLRPHSFPMRRRRAALIVRGVGARSLPGSTLLVRASSWHATSCAFRSIYARGLPTHVWQNARRAEGQSWRKQCSALSYRIAVRASRMRVTRCPYFCLLAGTSCTTRVHPLDISEHKEWRNALLTEFLPYPSVAHACLRHVTSFQTKPRGFIATGAMIVRRETPLALYKGLGAVLSGIVPKMAIRFASFEKYKAWLADKETGKTSVGNIFICAFWHCVREVSEVN